MKALQLDSNSQVLLPAYIGWSSREGSGVFDPIKELNLNYQFYAVDQELHIDRNDLLTRIDHVHENSVLVLIHYFGKPDPNVIEIISRARRRGIRIIEDAAHALYSSWVGGGCGHLGDAVIYSLHKMLPTKGGGILQVNSLELVERIPNTPSEGDKLLLQVAAQYDLVGIARSRKKNEEILRDLLQPYRGKIDLLWPDLTCSDVVLQTLPVIIREQSREDFYYGLNDAGFGAVSLYHTMIQEISADQFPVSFQLARSLLNLPIHQECSEESLREMVLCMESLLK